MSSETASGLGSPGTNSQADDNPVKSFGIRFVRAFMRDDLTGMAAEIAYHLIFAIPPLIILVVMLTSLLNNYTGIPVESNFHQLVNDHAPGDLQPVLNSVINNAIVKVGGGAVSLGIALTAILALWSGSNGIGSLIKGFNQMHDVEEGRPFVKKKLLTLGLTIALIFSIIVAFALFVFGQQIGDGIAGKVGLGPTFNTTWTILRWPIAILFVMVLLGLLYYYGPNASQSWKYVTISAVVATILWIVAVFGFKLYLSLSNPGSTYGAFGGLIVFLFFLYMTSLVFLVGAEITAILEQMRSHDMAGAPASGPSMTSGGSAHEVTESEIGPTHQLSEADPPESVSVSAKSPRDAAGRKEPTS